MNKIHFAIRPDANYVYHMLSVSKCGYDNAHGERYRHLYPAEDLAILKHHEKLLTVNGGEYCGALYWYLVCQPACGRVSIQEYYHNFQPDSCLNAYSAEIRDICTVMSRNYDRFFSSIWREICREIADYTLALAEMFDNSRFTEQAESLLEVSLETPVFYAVMTNSMENGPEAIDIAPDQDVFSITHSLESSFRFIAHEYIIYLLKSALRGTSAFQNFHTWEITEALADYYLIRILGNSGVFSRNNHWIAFYSKMESDATPLARYLAAEALLNQPIV